MQRRLLLKSAALGYGLASLTLPLLGHALEAPKGRPILTISGAVGEVNAGKTARLDMDMLAALPQHSFVTHTPWYDSPKKFTGPLLSDVLAMVKAKGKTLKAVAINDYAIEIPFEDLDKYKVVLARLLDDQPMAIREKGPLFVIYNFDSDAELRKSTYYERCIWQLKSIEVR